MKTVVCFGEVLLRLSPPGAEMLLQSPRLEARIGGAEANVGVSLARFGHPVRMVSFLPDNRLGRAALGELRRHGLDVGGVRTAPGRMGLYFLTPAAGQRPAEVLYDRADSSFALADPAAVDWNAELEGADWLHLSGVTPAIGPNAAEAALTAVRAARVKGLTVSFDGNYRKSLWDQWPTDGAAVLADIVAAADILIGDDRDVALILGHDFPHTDPMERRLAAAEAAFTGFPQLSRVASTHRTVHDATRHGLAGFLAERDGHWTAPPREIGGIVDRIGGGDAFAAGLIHGLRTQMAPQAALDFALAAAALKHSIPGDFNLVDLADVEALMAGGGDVRR
ncbi:MAG: sugar kinase [Phenylobacterium sp.]|jgi:2-dehydro-3-deoxygluconokinase|uniref:sugar kinase n=1 Tax=Phenylobacterium sp. TaxID=1871053 RepID=UPI002A36E371|nr:sugar kinase [Phenylobacterium sp.]MDX9998795.1 sugar kinase [Phenylobacterium sp.]